MEQLLTAIRFLQSLLKVPVTLGINGQLDTVLFEHTHCFSPTYQPTVTSSYLDRLVHTIHHQTIYEIHEPLETVMLLFYVQNNIVLIGPYTESAWDNSQGEQLLICLGIPSSYFTDYKFYHCSYNSLDSAYALNVTKAFLETVSTGFSNYTYEKLLISSQDHNQTITISKQHGYEQVNHRYMVETDFMAALQEGDAGKAALMLSKLRSLPQRFDYMHYNTWNHITGETTLRTICRIAARQSGLPPIVIDSICQEYAKKLYSKGIEHGSRKSHSLANEMVNDLCREIRKFKQTSYPPIVRKAIYYTGQ